MLLARLCKDALKLAWTVQVGVATYYSAGGDLILSLSALLRPIFFPLIYRQSLANRPLSCCSAWNKWQMLEAATPLPPMHWPLQVAILRLIQPLGLQPLPSSDPSSAPMTKPLQAVILRLTQRLSRWLLQSQEMTHMLQKFTT